LGKRSLFRVEDSTGISLQRVPASAVFGISPVFLKPKGAVLARKDIDAIVAMGIFDGCENLVGHGRCDG